MTKPYIFIAILLIHSFNAFGSYIPPYYDGLPITMSVTSLDPPNFTGYPVYRIEFELETNNEIDQADQAITNGFVHRLT